MRPGGEDQRVRFERVALPSAAVGGAAQHVHLATVQSPDGGIGPPRATWVAEEPLERPVRPPPVVLTTRGVGLVQNGDVGSGA
ncbi:hypothetical protein GCM10029964_066700 [Kibdelosporangium lantanae]